MKQKKSTKKTMTLGIAIIAMMAVILASIFVGRLYQERIWSYEGRFNVLDIDSYTLMSYPSRPNEAIVEVYLPKNVYFLVPEGYGYYQLEDIVELSQVEGRGDELVLKSVSYSLGIPVEQSISNLSIVDSFKIWQSRQSATKDPRIIALEKEPIFTTIERKDGQSINQVDSNKVDRYLSDVFWEIAVKEEPYTVGVFNASEYPGLATGIGRLLEHVGFRVVEVANWDDSIGDDCTIRYYGEKVAVESSHSFKRLSKLLSCSTEHVSVEKGRYTFEVVVTDAI